MYTPRIEKIIPLTPRVLHLFFSLPESSPLTFTAGQYGTVVINQTTRRQYSFCSDPKDTHGFEFLIDTTPMGPGSTYFLERKPGDTISLLAPLGSFCMQESPRKKMLIATGSGIAPFRSMILDAVDRTPIAVLWGLRQEDNRYWHKEFTLLADKYPTFSYTLYLSQPQGTWTGKTGHVTDHIQNEPNLKETDFYLCGNTQMIAEVKQILSAHQVPEGQIRTESF